MELEKLVNYDTVNNMGKNEFQTLMKKNLSKEELLNSLVNKGLTFGMLTKAVLGEEPKDMNSKNKQLKDIITLVDVKTNESGRKYIIVQVYDEPKERIDYRKNNSGSNIRYIPQFKLNKEDSYKSGVYKIEKNNKVYIGSTKNFRARYLSHLHLDDELAPCVYELLKDDNHTFETLEIVEDLSTLTEREQHWLEYYSNLEGYDVVNLRKAYRKEEPKVEKPKVEKINIRINKNEYERAIEILKENGIEIL